MRLADKYNYIGGLKLSKEAEAMNQACRRRKWCVINIYFIVRMSLVWVLPDGTYSQL